MNLILMYRRMAAHALGGEMVLFVALQQKKSSKITSQAFNQTDS